MFNPVSIFSIVSPRPPVVTFVEYQLLFQEFPPAGVYVHEFEVNGDE